MKEQQSFLYFRGFLRGSEKFALYMCLRDIGIHEESVNKGEKVTWHVN